MFLYSRRQTVSLSAWSLLLLALPNTSAGAIPPKDVSYLCVAEIVGGLWYNKTTNKWEGSTFKPTEKFLLRLKYIDSRLGTEFWDKDETYANFQVTVTKSGTNTGLPCGAVGA